MNVLLTRAPDTAADTEELAKTFQGQAQEIDKIFLETPPSLLLPFSPPPSSLSSFLTLPAPSSLYHSKRLGTLKGIAVTDPRTVDLVQLNPLHYNPPPPLPVPGPHLYEFLPL